MPLLDTRDARLGVALAARGLTKADVAACLGVDAAMVSRWCAGAKSGSVDAAALARALGGGDELAAALDVGGPWEPLVRA